MKPAKGKAKAKETKKTKTENKGSTKHANGEKTAYSAAKEKFAQESLAHLISHSYPNSYSTEEFDKRV